MQANNQPAFPGPYANKNGNLEVLFKQQGMTLRDYFAAKAMQGMLACSNLDAKLKADAGLIATSAYQFADAMMKAREA